MNCEECGDFIKGPRALPDKYGEYKTICTSCHREMTEEAEIEMEMIRSENPEGSRNTHRSYISGLNKDFVSMFDRDDPDD